MQYIQTYFAILREAYNDIAHLFESDVIRGFMVIAAVLTPIFGTLLFFVAVVNAVYLAPAQTVEIETIQTSNSTIAIMLNNNETLLNTAEIELYFNPAYIHVSDLTIETELCEERFLITKEIDNTAGRIFYQCGTITPFKGTSTTLATLSILPLIPGTSNLTFGPNTSTLAHDGHGSNVTKTRVRSVFVTQS